MPVDPSALRTVSSRTDSHGLSYTRLLLSVSTGTILLQDRGGPSYATHARRQVRAHYARQIADGFG
jgi:hypothetical protein